MFRAGVRARCFGTAAYVGLFQLQPNAVDAARLSGEGDPFLGYCFAFGNHKIGVAW